MTEEQQLVVHPVRRAVVHGLALIEDTVYAALGVLLAVAALALLVAAFWTFKNALIARALPGQIVNLLDQILLILLIVELLYTVQVSFREHRLLAEPFLVVALIAVIRRILILTAEVSKLQQADEVVFRQVMLELALLTTMIAALVGSLIMLGRQTKRGVQGTIQ